MSRIRFFRNVNDRESRRWSFHVEDVPFQAPWHAVRAIPPLEMRAGKGGGGWVFLCYIHRYCSVSCLPLLWTLVFLLFPRSFGSRVIPAVFAKVQRSCATTIPVFNLVLALSVFLAFRRFSPVSNSSLLFQARWCPSSNSQIHNQSRGHFLSTTRWISRIFTDVPVKLNLLRVFMKPHGILM